MKRKIASNIKTWAEADRPREKMIQLGRKSLTDSELLAVIIGSGNSKESAVDLSRRILKKAGNSLSNLGLLSIDELLIIRGIGKAKAITIVAAMELGRRRRGAEPIKSTISSSEHAFQFIEEIFSDLQHEEFWVLLLNRGNKLLDRVNISKGGVSGTVVDSRIVFKLAIDKLASGVILCHNHPSGNLKPSQADLMLTKKLKEAGNIMEIPVLDHIIVHDSSYFSFADEGLI